MMFWKNHGIVDSKRVGFKVRELYHNKAIIRSWRELLYQAVSWEIINLFFLGIRSLCDLCIFFANNLKLHAIAMSNPC